MPSDLFLLFEAPFFAAINCGVFIAYLIVPAVRNVAGYPAAISLGLAMLFLSLVLLVSGRPWYRMVPPTGKSMYSIIVGVVAAADPCYCLRKRTPAVYESNPSAQAVPVPERAQGIVVSGEASPLLGVVATPAHTHATGLIADARDACKDKLLPESVTNSVTAKLEDSSAPVVTSRPKSSWLERARGTVADADIDGTARVFRLLPVFACLPVFWMLDDSQDSIWTLQRRSMDLCAGGVCIAVEQLGAVNPFLVMVLVPLFSNVIFPVLYAQPLAWLRPHPIRQMAIGMQLAALAFVGSAALQSRIDASGPGTVPVLLQIPQIFVLTLAEVLISATGLEFAYSQAPPAFKGSIVAVYYLSIALGDFIAAAVYSSLASILSSAQVLLVYASLMSATGIVFLAVAYSYLSASASDTPR